MTEARPKAIAMMMQQYAAESINKSFRLSEWTVPNLYIPVCLSLGYIFVYKVRTKKMRIAQRVKVRLMAIGIRKSHSICVRKPLSQAGIQGMSLR
jgi:hypothetical protein